MSLEKYFCSTSKYSHNIAKKDETHSRMDDENKKLDPHMDFRNSQNI